MKKNEEAKLLLAGITCKDCCYSAEGGILSADCNSIERITKCYHKGRTQKNDSVLCDKRGYCEFIIA